MPLLGSARTETEPPEPAIGPSAEHTRGQPPSPEPATSEPPGASGAALDPASGARQVPKILGALVAPTTLVTALLFYFGWSHAYWFFDYFGVNSTLLGLTTGDYVQRSVDGLWVPVMLAGCVVLAAVWSHAVMRGRLAPDGRDRLLRALLPVSGVTGLALASGGLVSVFTATPLAAHLALAPLSFASGVLLLMASVHLGRSRRTREIPEPPPRSEWVGVVEWAGVFLLVGLSLFWATNDYSVAVGQSRARQFAAGLPSQPSVVLYSAKSLELHAPGVREVRCTEEGGAYRVRYDGLKLMLQSGDQYVFLPATWSREDGVALVLPRSESLRLEFRPSSVRDPDPGSSC